VPCFKYASTSLSSTAKRFSACAMSAFVRFCASLNRLFCCAISLSACACRPGIFAFSASICGCILLFASLIRSRSRFINTSNLVLVSPWLSLLISSVQRLTLACIRASFCQLLQLVQFVLYPLHFVQYGT